VVGLVHTDGKQHRDRSTGEPVDLGRVGEISDVRADFLRGLLEQQIIPVIAPVAVDSDLQSLNVNADTVATAVAIALGAARLIFLTDVDGIHGSTGVPEPELTTTQVEAMMADGTIAGGMIPKAEACLQALRGGVGRVTVADGRVPHALLVELLTDDGVGTLIRST
jgi:acetylglutamate kinase